MLPFKQRFFVFEKCKGGNTMARETKTIQMYPDDDAINQAISLWENFGWEVIGNQRCQEFKKQDSDGTQHFETFNKITFSRDKSASWYGKVAELEQEYIATENELQSKSKQGNPYNNCAVDCRSCFGFCRLQIFKRCSSLHNNGRGIFAAHCNLHNTNCLVQQAQG